MSDDLPIDMSEKYQDKLKTIKGIVRSAEAKNRESKMPYTPHGISHIERLEELLLVLFPGKDDLKNLNDKFNDKEKFFLFASIWLHDIGMFSNKDLFPDDPEPSIDGLLEWDRDVRRKLHHERSASFILRNRSNLGLEDSEARDLALICRSHRKSQKIPDYTDENIRLIIAYLRLLDALDIPNRPSRDNIGQLLTRLAEGNMDPVSKFHWYKAFYVSEIAASPNELKLVIKISLPEEWEKSTEKLKPLIKAIEKDIKDELDAVKDILIKSKIFKDFPAYKYVSCDFKLTPYTKEEIDDLESLLAITRLFDATISPNSGEIVNIVLEDFSRTIERTDETKFIEHIKEYIKYVLNPLLKYRPCHAYLWNLKDELEKRAEKLEYEPAGLGKIDEIRRGNEIKVKKIYFYSEIRDLIKALQWWRKELPDIFNVRGIVKKTDNILLYGYSSAVVYALKQLDDEVKTELDVFICECNTKTKHRYNNKIIYHDGFKYVRELKAIGIKKLSLIPDICASNLFFNGMNSKKKITKVFFGANAVTEKYIFHSLGHLAIAEMVIAANERMRNVVEEKKEKHDPIEIFVIAEGMKVRRELERSQDNQREGPWYPTDVCCLDCIKNVTIINPREDVVPIGNITRIITESGSFCVGKPFEDLMIISPQFAHIESKFNEWRDKDEGIVKNGGKLNERE